MTTVTSPLRAARRTTAREAVDAVARAHGWTPAPAVETVWARYRRDGAGVIVRYTPAGSIQSASLHYPSGEPGELLERRHSGAGGRAVVLAWLAEHGAASPLSHRDAIAAARAAATAGACSDAVRPGVLDVAARLRLHVEHVGGPIVVVRPDGGQRVYVARRTVGGGYEALGGACDDADVFADILSVLAAVRARETADVAAGAAADYAAAAAGLEDAMHLAEQAATLGELADAAAVRAAALTRFDAASAAYDALTGEGSPQRALMDLAGEPWARAAYAHAVVTMREMMSQAAPAVDGVRYARGVFDAMAAALDAPLYGTLAALGCVRHVRAAHAAAAVVLELGRDRRGGRRMRAADRRATVRAARADMDAAWSRAYGVRDLARREPVAPIVYDTWARDVRYAFDVVQDARRWLHSPDGERFLSGR